MTHRAPARNAWLDALGEQHGLASLEDRLRALEAIARYVRGGPAVSADVRAWFAAAVLRFVARAKAGREDDQRLSLDAALDVGRAALPATARRNERNTSLRFVARVFPGCAWQRAATLAAVVHGTGVAPTAEAQQQIERLREEHGSKLPRSQMQMYRILKRSREQ